MPYTNQIIIQGHWHRMISFFSHYPLNHCHVLANSHLVTHTHTHTKTNMLSLSFPPLLTGLLFAATPSDGFSGPPGPETQQSKGPESRGVPLLPLRQNLAVSPGACPLPVTPHPPSSRFPRSSFWLCSDRSSKSEC